MKLSLEDQDLLEGVVKRNDLIDVIRTLAIIVFRQSVAIEVTNRNRLRVAQTSLTALADYLETIYVR